MPQKSPVDDFIFDAKSQAFRWIYSHDRYVLLALFLALIPLPPSNVLALLFSLLNSYLIFSGRMPRREWRVVALTFLLAPAMLALFWFAASLVGEYLPFIFKNSAINLIELLRNIFWLPAVGLGGGQSV